MARAAPNMKTAPVVILSLVKRSERTSDVSTFPEIRFPEESSSLTVIVASPIEEGIRVCQIILDFSMLAVISVKESCTGWELFLYGSVLSRYTHSFGRKSGV